MALSERSSGGKVTLLGSRTRLIGACLFGLLTLGAWYWLKYRDTIPGPTESSFAAAVEQRDWAAVYDLAVGSQISKSASKDQFVILMDSLSRDLPSEYFKDASLQELPGRASDYSRGTHGVNLVLPHGPTISGVPPEQVLHVFRDRSGWKVAINEFPIRINRFHSGSKKEEWQRMSKAMKAAGITEYWVTMKGPVFSIDRIEQFVAGKIPEPEIYSRR